MERGQFLERMTVIPVPSGPTLEGLYQAGQGERPTLVISGHTALGGTMEAAVPTELCWALSLSRRPTLRFNWRGVGASTGEAAVRALVPDDLAAALNDDERAIEPYAEDAAAALEQLRETWPETPIDVIGYSFGARVAAEIAGRGSSAPGSVVGRTVLIAPPSALSWRSVDGVAAVVTGALDRHAPPEALAALFPDALRMVVPAADHRFVQGLSELGSRVVACLEDLS